MVELRPKKEDFSQVIIAQKIALWISGIVAGACLGGALDMAASGGAGFGLVGGAFTFISVRLWFVLALRNSN